MNNENKNAAPASQAGPAPKRSSFLDLLLFLAEHLRLLTLVPLLVGLVALGLAFLVPPTYTATTKILPPQQAQGMANAILSQLGGVAGLAGAAAGIKNPADQYVAFIKSRSISDQIIKRFKLQEFYEDEYLEDTRKRLEKRLSVASGKEGLITINIDDKSPKQAADIANAYVEELRNLMARLAVTEAAQRRVFFEKQMDKARSKLADAEAVLKASGVGESMLKITPNAALESLARLRAQVTAQELRLAAMKNFVTEANPEFQRAQAELGALRAELGRREGSETVPAGSAETGYADKYRSFKYAETLYELMAKQYEAARLDEVRDGALVQVVDLAIAPEKKSKPRRALIAIGATVGTMLVLIAFLFVRVAYRRAMRDEHTALKLSRLQALVRGARSPQPE